MWEHLLLIELDWHEYCRPRMKSRISRSIQRNLKRHRSITSTSSFCVSTINASLSSAVSGRLFPFKVVFPHTPSTLRPQFSWFTYFFVKRQCGATSLRNRVINAAKFAVIKISFEHSTHIQTDRRSCCSSIAPCALFTLTRDYSKTVAHFCC